MKIEKNLWRNGILTWTDFLQASNIYFINHIKKRQYDKHLSIATKNLADKNTTFFINTTRKKEHWRFFDIFKEEAVCLDIETNGLSPDNGGYVTVVGIYDGFDYKYFIKDLNLSTENLNRELSRYKYLITFYGSIFDIPYLKKTMPKLTFNQLHFDICFGARRLGFKRGLKTLEKELGIERNEEVKNMNGYDAVRMWEFAKRGSTEAMNLLVSYNREDTINLFKIASIIYQGLRAQTGILKYL